MEFCAGFIKWLTRDTVNIQTDEMEGTGRDNEAWIETEEY